MRKRGGGRIERKEEEERRAEGKRRMEGRDPEEKLLEDFEQSMTCSIYFLKTAVSTGVTSESDWILCRFIG